MDRWSSWTLSALFLATVAIVVASARAPKPTGATAASAPSASATEPRAGDPPHATAPDDGPRSAPSASATTARPLPPGAPAAVRIGVIQFSYRGAELAAATAPAREVALARARAALDTARTDFPKAVALGDPASGADLGTLPRGVLEPDVEYVVFTLEPGAVHGEPIDTPRGYWVVRRVR